MLCLWIILIDCMIMHACLLFLYHEWCDAVFFGIKDLKIQIDDVDKADLQLVMTSNGFAFLLEFSHNPNSITARPWCPRLQKLLRPFLSQPQGHMQPAQIATWANPQKYIYHDLKRPLRPRKKNYWLSAYPMRVLQHSSCELVVHGFCMSLLPNPHLIYKCSSPKVWVEVSNDRAVPEPSSPTAKRTLQFSPTKTSVAASPEAKREKVDNTQTVVQPIDSTIKAESKEPETSKPAGETGGNGGASQLPKKPFMFGGMTARQARSCILVLGSGSPSVWQIHVCIWNLYMTAGINMQNINFKTCFCVDVFHEWKKTFTQTTFTLPAASTPTSCQSQSGPHV